MRECGHDDRTGSWRPTGSGRAGLEVGGDGVAQVDGGVEGVDMDAVRDLAGHAQHPRIDRGEVDRRVRHGDRSRRPHRGEERELPELPPRSEEHTSELQSLMRISYAVFCLKNK